MTTQKHDDSVTFELEPDASKPEIDEITGEVVKTETKPTEETKKPASDDAIADLQSQIDGQRRKIAEERALREKAERRMLESEQRAQFSQTQAEDTQLTAVQNAIRAVDAEADTAERAFKDAMAAQDFDTAAKAQRYMSALEARKLQLENGKAALEDRAKVAKEQPAQQPQRKSQEQELNDWIDTLTPESKEWVGKHRDLFADPAKAQKIGAAHMAAVNLEGLRPDTPEYFDFVERKVGLKAEETKTRDKPTPSAPVNAAGSGGSRSATSINLTPEMLDLAHSLYPDMKPKDAERQYAKDRAADIAEGKLKSEHSW